MQQSAEVMAAMNQLVRLPALHKVMMGMAREMEKAGMIEEVMEDMFEDMEGEEVEEEAAEEVDKVFLEITAGIMEKAGAAGRAKPGADAQAQEEEVAQPLSGADEELLQRARAL